MRKYVPQLVWYRPFEPLAFAAIRFGTGLIVLMHGVQRLFYGAAVKELGPQLAALSPSAVGTVELIGGTALALGLLTRPLALLFALEWLAVALSAHVPPEKSWFMFGAILFGAMGWPDVRYPDGTEPIPQLDLRMEFGLYAGVRPIRWFPGLPRVLAEEVLERPVDDVRRGVGARGRGPADLVHLGVRLLPGTHLPRLHDRRMDGDAPGTRLRVEDPEEAAGGSDVPRIADLAAALRVEGGPIEHDTDLVALGRHREGARRADDGTQRRVDGGPLVAEELRRADLGRDRREVLARATLLRRLLRPLPLRGHALIEAGLVDREIGRAHV